MSEFSNEPETDKEMLDKVQAFRARLPKEHPIVEIGEGCSIGSSAWLDGNYLYFGSCNYYIYCLDKRDGSLVWKQRTGGVVFSSPQVEYKKVYVGSNDNHVYALDKSGGEIIWKYRTNGPVYGASTFYRNRIYVGGDDNYFYCLDAKTGELIWKFYCSIGSSSTPVILNGNILFTSHDKNL